MTSTTYHGVVKAGAIVLQEDAPHLAEGTEVLVTLLRSAPGTPAAVLAAVAAAPPVPAAWVDELDQLIAEGQSPPSRADPFAEQPNYPEEG